MPVSVRPVAVHVAQINIGTMVAPTDDPRVAEFMPNGWWVIHRPDGTPLQPPDAA